LFDHINLHTLPIYTENKFENGQINISLTNDSFTIKIEYNILITICGIFGDLDLNVFG